MNLADQVRHALEQYAEGGTIGEHLDQLNMRRGDFYAYLRANPAIKNAYHDIQAARADMMVDETYGLDCADPRSARVKAEIRLKIAALYDRPRFGDRVALDVQTVDLTGALAEARTRTLRPPCDLVNVSDAQVIEETARPQLLHAGVKPATPVNDIFADD
jgi:hypothetical protein